VSSIGNFAFSECTSLTTITSLRANAPSLGTNPFNNVAATKIIVPAGATASYVAAGAAGKYGGLIIEET
jgi:hypothetical protein